MFKSFKAEVENQLGKKIKAVRSTLVVNTTADMLDHVNNVQYLLLNS